MIMVKVMVKVKEQERTVYTVARGNTKQEYSSAPWSWAPDTHSGVLALVRRRLGGGRYVHLDGVPETRLPDQDVAGAKQRWEDELSCFGGFHCFHCFDCGW